MILSIPSVIKGQTATVTLSKSELFELNKIEQDEFFSNEQNVKSCVFLYKSTVGNQIKKLSFDLSQASPAALFKTTTRTRPEFILTKIVLEDFDGGTLTLKKFDLPQNLTITVTNP